MTPDHLFPLVARDGGTLIRAGHTEAAVDAARIAGLNPSGVICEIMNDDGSMSRLPDLLKFGKEHGLKIGTIADLIAYRLRTERLVELAVSSGLHHPAFGEWRMMMYRDTVENGEHIVLAKGDLARPEPALVCIHMADTVNGVLLARDGDPLHSAMYQIMRQSRGVIVILNDPRRDAVSERVRNGSPHSRPERFPQDYVVGAQILADLGVTDMVILSNTPQTFVGLDGYGLNVVEHLST